MKKNDRIKLLRKQNDEYYRKLGYTGTKSKEAHTLPNLMDGIVRVATSDQIPGNGSKRSSTKYTGDYVLGIATMHKSNAIPITSKEDAEHVGKMRR